MNGTMIPYVREYMVNNFIFPQDNDIKYTVKIVKQYFMKENITVLLWPSQSPDLNPIETGF